MRLADRSGSVGKDRAVDSNYATNRAIEPVSIHHSAFTPCVGYNSWPIYTGNTTPYMFDVYTLVALLLGEIVIDWLSKV